MNLGYLDDVSLGGPADVVAADVAQISKVGGDMGLHQNASQCELIAHSNFSTTDALLQFIYLGSKQSSNGYCRPDVLRRIGFACSVMNSLQRVWSCSNLVISYQSIPSIPCHRTDKVCSALRCRNTDALGRRHQYTGGFLHEVSATGT